MKATGIVRSVDELGRVVLPKKIRNEFEIDSRDPIEIFLDEDKIILKKYTPACVFCGGSESTFYYKNTTVCSECAKKISLIAE